MGEQTSDIIRPLAVPLPNQPLSLHFYLSLQRMGEQSADWPLDRTLEATAPYAATAAAVAADLGLPCLDLFNLLQKVTRRGGTSVMVHGCVRG